MGSGRGTLGVGPGTKARNELTDRINGNNENQGRQF